MIRQAAEQALDALDCIYSPLHVREINKVGAAMTALREALAQPEQRSMNVEVTELVQRAFAQEREACAALCEQFKGTAEQEWLAQLLADRIRAREDLS